MKIPTPTFGFFPKKFVLFVIASIVTVLLVLLVSAGADYYGLTPTDYISSILLLTIVSALIGWTILNTIYEAIRSGRLGTPIIRPGLIFSLMIADIAEGIIMVVILFAVAVIAIPLAVVTTFFVEPILLLVGAAFITPLLIITVTIVSWFITWYIYEKYTRRLF